MTIVGIPNTLFNFKHPVLWSTFFKELGVKTIVSTDTNLKILDESVKLSDSECCLSVKLLAWHTRALIGKCDFIFVPTLSSEKKGYLSCPRFKAVPHLAKIFTNGDTRILTADYNRNYHSKAYFLFKLGIRLNHNPWRVYKAVKKAISCEDMDCTSRTKRFGTKAAKAGKKILIISHPYILADKFMNHSIVSKLEGMGAVPIPIDEVPFEEKSTEIKWDFAKEVLNCIDYALDNKTFDGIIQITNFNCGCDSVTVDIIRDKIKNHDVSYLNLIIDEHTAEAGIETRLEAFIDSL